MQPRLHHPLHLPDPAATEALARHLASRIGAGDTLLLEGDLGAGKSHFARALIQTLQAPDGIRDEVPSPTYTLMQIYRAGGYEIVHADLYRIGDPTELDELGLTDVFGRSVTIVEWPDRLGNARPQGALTIALQVSGAGRTATLSGDGWEGRL